VVKFLSGRTGLVTHADWAEELPYLRLTKTNPSIKFAKAEAEPPPPPLERPYSN